MISLNMTDAEYVTILIEKLRDGEFDDGKTVDFQGNGYTITIGREALFKLEYAAAYFKKFPHVSWRIDEDVGLIIPNDDDRAHYILSMPGERR